MTAMTTPLDTASCTAAPGSAQPNSRSVRATATASSTV